MVSIKKRVFQGLGIIAILLLIASIWFYQNWYKLPGIISRWKDPIGATIPIKWEEGPKIRSSDRPNLIVILVDDLGFNEVSTYGGGLGNSQYKTNHIDRMAAEGTLCTNGYSAHAVCSPSRASLMTGRYATRFGFEFTPTSPNMMKFVAKMNNGMAIPPLYHEELEGIGPEVDDMGMPLSEITIAELLKNQGYHSIHLGKWHLGNSEKFLPKHQGFDESLNLNQGSLFLPVNDPNVVNARLPFDPIDKFLWGNLSQAVAWDGGPRFHPEGHTTDYLTNQAVKAIEANKNRPFFMYLAYWAVHAPLQANKKDYDQLSYIEDHAERVQAAMVMTVDRGVGKVMQALKDQGIDDNTMVVFTSDNGAPGYLGMPNLNQPYRGWKLSLFEGGIHIPYIVRWPGKIPAGQIYEERVSNIDLLPTFGAIAGAKLPTDRKIDGINILPFLTGENKEVPNRTLYGKISNYSYVIDQNWKLQVDALQGKKWLFDLSTDPTEQRNLVASETNRVRSLTNLLNKHIAEQKKPLWPALLDNAVFIDKHLNEKTTKDDEYIYWPN